MTRLLVSSLLAFSVFAATGASAAVYDATTDFQTLSNPGEVWSYGYANPVGSTYSMTLFDDHSPAGWSMHDYNTAGTPAIWKNPAAYTQNGVAPGQVSLHPGPVPDGDFAILRFTAPTAGTYDYTGLFGAGHYGDTSGRLVFNGDLLNPLVSFASTGNSPTFIGVVAMMTGQTLDLVVGNNSDFSADNTPVSFTITSTPVTAPIPEPETYAMMMAGLGLLGVVARRRKQKSAT
jgi:hypothetical protein